MISPEDIEIFPYVETAEEAWSIFPKPIRSADPEKGEEPCKTACSKGLGNWGS